MIDSCFNQENQKVMEMKKKVLNIPFFYKLDIPVHFIDKPGKNLYL